MMTENILVTILKERFKQPKDNVVHFVEDEDANKLLNDLEHHPHAFVLACCMDRQTKAERAWMIPYKIKRSINSFEMKDLITISEEQYKTFFTSNNLHRFNDAMATVFYRAVQRLHAVYHDDASEIWRNTPESAEVVYKFLEFDGVGIKIATMAANILATQYRIPLSDYYSIDVSPDVHVRRVMKRMGLVEYEEDNKKGNDKVNDLIIYKARELNPKFPGIIDYPLWKIGRTCCRSNNPSSNDCAVKLECKYKSLLCPKQRGCKSYGKTYSRSC